MVNAQKRSSYLDYLPGIFDGGQTSFLNGFLLAFERLLTGLGEPSDSEDTLRGIEESLDGIRTVDGKWQQAGIERYFSPQSVIPKEERATGSQDERFQTPKEFLDWLAGWVALEIRIDLDESERRALIARAVQLYRLRGTKAGLEQLLEILTAPFTREQERLALKLPPNSVEKLGGIAGQSYGLDFGQRLLA